MARVLIVGVGLMGRPYLEAALRWGHEVRVVETAGWDAAGSGASVTRLPDADRPTEEDWVSGAFAAAVEFRPEAVVGFAEPHVLAAAMVADRFGLPGPSTQAAVISRNKALQRAVLGAHHPDRQPAWVPARPGPATLDWARDRYPVVVKPLHGSGSEGVELVGSEAALRRRLDRLPGGLVEEYVTGPEYSWEGLVREGVIVFGSVTEKSTSGPPHFVETAHVVPAPLPPERVKDVVAFVEDVLAAIGLATGLVHLEFRLADGGPRLMEVAVRTPGDFLFALLADAWDFDPYEQVLRLALGEDVRVRDRSVAPGCAAIAFLRAGPGRVRGVEGVEAARALPGVRALRVSVGPGDVVGELESSADRVGYVRVAGADADHCRAVLDHALALIRVDTEESDDAQ